MTKDRAELERILSLTDGHCAYCGKELHFKHEWHIEHVIPRSKGGKHKDNLVAACSRCNLRKGCYTPEQFREWIPRKIRRLLEPLFPDIEDLCELLPRDDAIRILDAIWEICDTLESTYVEFYAEDLLAKIQREHLARED